jgi:two-component sensor histidine kinase
MSNTDQRNNGCHAPHHRESQLAAELERQKFLLAEAQRRLRNTFATIRSIMRQTASGADSVEDFVSHFAGRIDVLCRVQPTLASDPFAGFELTGLVYEELQVCAVREGEQFTLKGPAVRLRPRIAESIGLAIHELATNAIKFGAFAAPHGRVDIAWQTAPRGNHTWLYFDWKESGMRGRPVVEARRGFGMTLLQEALTYDLGAEVKREFAPSGFHCCIALPLPAEGER